jgi:hypothetical protein
MVTKATNSGSGSRWGLIGLLAGAGDLVAVAWFTAAADRAQVQVAFSTDAGRTLGQPLRVDEGSPLGGSTS